MKLYFLWQIVQLSTLVSSQHHDDLHIRTPSFSIHGSLASENVRRFAGIPYAEPPVGSNRFRPPVTKKPYTTLHNATSFGPSCLQYDTGAPSLGDYLPAQRPNSGQSEDCLNLNIWTPRATNLTNCELLPVMIWIPGGALLSGGSSAPNYDGTSFVENQNIILVSINYRVNIFGFPAAAALDGRHHNVGLLDQRAAVEWLYNNIYAFGGDAKRMTLFGQSAGASSTDFFSYAWWNDPLVNGLIIQSGAVGDNDVTYSQGTSNFTYVAGQVGCGNLTKDEELACMQSTDSDTILAVYETYNATANGGRSLGFGASADEETIFSNFSSRRARGLVAKLPAIIGTTENEWASLYSPFSAAAPNQTTLDTLTNSVFSCPAAVSSNFRAGFGLPVYRYRYFGEFPNLNPLPWLGAYHAAEIPVVFGTSSLSGEDTEREKELSKWMQGAWAAFAKDPVGGLEGYGWPRYVQGKDTLVLLGREEGTVEVGSAEEFDAVCE
ncbi:hypothetical protein N0V90_004014 [Kalmusia sp. IMI 367209]|nr:hypothetical protein N0V90_004014 [Kalmusia sp. IMI 367209]